MASHDMDPSDPASPFIPTLERARREGVELPDEEPLSQQRLTALVVYATLLRRRTWAEDVEMPWERMSQFPRVAPPAPTDFTPRSHGFIEREISVDNCTACAATPGKMKCRVCKGTGVLGQIRFHCSCEGGFVPCPVCRGEAMSQRVRVRYFNDEPLQLRDAYLPSHLTSVPSLFSFESTFERTINLDIAPPEPLRVNDLANRVGDATAYRGGERRQRPDFRGHDFGDTIEKAIGGLGAVSAGSAVPYYVLNAFAWPIVWLHYLEKDIALFVGRLGLIVAFGI